MKEKVPLYCPKCKEYLRVELKTPWRSPTCPICGTRVIGTIPQQRKPSP